MRIQILLFLVLVLPISLAAQIAENAKTQILIQENSAYFEIFNASKTLSQLDCPPKLISNSISTFNFIDSLPLPALQDEKLFSEIIPFNCNELYQFVLIHNHYLPKYKKALSQQGLDEKFALLPLILSGSNPALKFEKDKSGAWQLSYVTARKYGLEISPLVDERNDVVKSSRAAAEYISFLHTYYLNNELLVATAYFTSIPFVNKQINALDTVNPITFYNALPVDVQLYFSAIKTWTHWFKNLDLQTVQLEFDESQKWAEVSSGDTLLFSTISTFMEISEKEIERINPVLIGKKVIPNASQKFYLPSKKATQFEDKNQEFIAFQKAEKKRKEKELEELRKKMEKGIPDLTTHTAITYTVKSGDVLGRIASRNNVKVSQIKQWNDLHSDRINVGQKLTLYVPNNKAKQHPKEKASEQVARTPAKPKPGKGSPTIYTVKAGDSLWLIAKKYPGVSAENIMEWNGISDKIDLGQKLKIYPNGN